MNNRLRNSDNSNSQNFTIANIADELGISKSTVSRVLSGKGRISESTKNKVLECAKAHNYTPNIFAKSLATSKSFNIGVIMPKDAAQTEMPFFHNCLAGISDKSISYDYDVLLSISNGNNTDHLEKTLKYNKVDGFIVTRLLKNDSRVELLKQQNLPFVVIGSTEDKEIVQVDSNNEVACCDFTKELINKGIKSFLLLCGDTSIVVNNSRYNGFIKAIKEMNISEDDFMVVTDVKNSSTVKETLENFSNKYECVICSDDVLSSYALNFFNDNKKNIPADIKLASFYDSLYLEQHKPSISAVKIDAYEIGQKAASVLCNKLQNEEVMPDTFVKYEFLFRDSTDNK